MNSSISAIIQQLPQLQFLIRKIDELLELRAVSHHEYLKIIIPKGLLHWPTVLEMSFDQQILVKMGVMGTTLEAIITPRDLSDTSGMSVNTIKFDRDNGESVYGINGVLLSLHDIRAFVAYLLSEFWPCSVSITESE